MEHQVEHAQTKVVILVFIALLLSPVAAHAALGLFGGGDGSSATPYLVEDEEDLNAIRNPGFLNKHYRLADDINLTGYLTSGGPGGVWGSDGWMPIGTFLVPFTGYFDGAGKTISGLWINRPAMEWVGLFGCIKDATVENLTVTTSGVVSGKNNVGVLTGGLLSNPNMNSSIINCHVNGNTSATYPTYVGEPTGTYVSGLAGFVYSAINGSANIINCSATGTIDGFDSVGGLVGIQLAESNGNNLIEKCFFTGQVLSCGTAAGGIVGTQVADGNSSCLINSCYTKCNIQGVSNAVYGMIGAWSAGGIAGCQRADNNGNSSITNCYVTGSFTNPGHIAGGIVGHQKTNNNSYNSIISCYVTSDIASAENFIGGIAGRQESSGAGDINRVLNCFSMGDISGVGPNVGGLVGGIVASTSIISDSYRYQLAKVNGVVIPASDPDHGPNRRHGDVSTSAAQFMTQATYSGNGWSFGASGPWYWNNNEKYPKLNIGTETYPFPFYAITYNLAGGAFSSVAEYSYIPGSSYTLPVPVRAFYLFDGWFDSSNTLVTNIRSTDTGHKEFWARWTPALFSVSVAPASGGSVTADYSSAPAGQTVTLTVTPDTRYRVASIVVHRTGVVSDVVTLTTVAGSDPTFVMPGFDVTVTTVFERSSYDISIHPSSTGRVSTDKTSAAPGETVTLTVTPVTGDELVSISATSVTLNGGGSTYTFTMPSLDVTVTATFRKTAAQLAWEAASPLIEKTVFTLTQQEAETERQAQYRLAELINALIKGTGFIVSAYDIVIYRFQPATAGDEANPLGTNGLCEFRVTPSDVRWSAYSSLIIIATPYDTSGNEAITQANPLKTWVQNGVLNVTGLTPGEILRVYTLNGTLIYQSIAGGDRAEVVLPVRGVYLVTYGNRTIKIMN